MQAWLYPGKQIKYQVTYSQRERKAVVPFQQAYRFSNVHKKYTGRYLILTENEIPGRQKVVRWSKVPVLTSHVGQNPRSCTALSLIDGRETRPRLVHASIARGITASLVSLCEAWLYLFW